MHTFGEGGEVPPHWGVYSRLLTCSSLPGVSIIQQFWELNQRGDSRRVARLLQERRGHSGLVGPTIGSTATDHATARGASAGRRSSRRGYVGGLPRGEGAPEAKKRCLSCGHPQGGGCGKPRGVTELAGGWLGAFQFCDAFTYMGKTPWGALSARGGAAGAAPLSAAPSRRWGEGRSRGGDRGRQAWGYGLEGA